LQKLYSTFPGGTPGIGLLILRTAAGIATGIYGSILLSRLDTTINSQFSYIGHLILSLVLITGSVFFILGLMMPFVSTAIAVSELIAAFVRLTLANPLDGFRFSWIALLLLASIATALIFLGPGAFSIDARLFGRRQIYIPSSKKEDGQQL
jgi:uncharacterized membrane protein YphA (DoxX/SURF4 family)